MSTKPVLVHGTLCLPVFMPPPATQTAHAVTRGCIRLQDRELSSCLFGARGMPTTNCWHQVHVPLRTNHNKSAPDLHGRLQHLHSMDPMELDERLQHLHSMDPIELDERRTRASVDLTMLRHQVCRQAQSFHWPPTCGPRSAWDRTVWKGHGRQHTHMVRSCIDVNRTVACYDWVPVPDKTSAVVVCNPVQTARHGWCYRCTGVRVLTSSIFHASSEASALTAASPPLGHNVGNFTKASHARGRQGNGELCRN